MNYAQVIAFSSSLSCADNISNLHAIDQNEYAPVSKNVDWKLIRNNLPKAKQENRKGK